MSGGGPPLSFMAYDDIDNERTIRVWDINDIPTPVTCDSEILGRIDQYEIQRELGGGGFGTVFLAKDTISDTVVAVKGLPPIVKNNREELENIRRNFALVGKLTHTNIAKMLVLHPAKCVEYANQDVKQKLRVSTSDYLMVMEYAPGATISKWRQQFPDGKVPVARAIDIVRQIASALDYAHSRKVIHRDIKPANIMVETTEEGSETVRVLDFGLAAEVRSSVARISQEVRDKSGTRQYMAPEQWLGGRQGPATDQYALAALFHELVVGEVPFASVFDTGDPVVMMNVVGRERFAAPRELPRHIRRALKKALSKKPQDRFRTCGEFVDALQTGGRKWLPICVLGSLAAVAAVASVLFAVRTSRVKTNAPVTSVIPGPPAPIVETPVPTKPVIPDPPVTMVETEVPVTPVVPADVQAPPVLPDKPVRVKDEPLTVDELERLDTSALSAGTVKTVMTKSGLKFNLVWCPPGRFVMGSPVGESGRGEHEDGAHEMEVEKGFWIGQYEVSYALWLSLMENYRKGDHNENVSDQTTSPVWDISRNDCLEFARRLNVENDTQGFRLPTEIEWEYACRAGTSTAYNFGDAATAGDVTFHSRLPSQFGLHKPNAWGIYDMHGNIAEWCDSEFQPGCGKYILRGGSWKSRTVEECRSASREIVGSNRRPPSAGMRLCFQALEENVNKHKQK